MRRLRKRRYDDWISGTEPERHPDLHEYVTFKFALVYSVTERLGGLAGYMADHIMLFLGTADRGPARFGLWPRPHTHAKMVSHSMIVKIVFGTDSRPACAEPDARSATLLTNFWG